jgi:hypothetical protein
MQSASNIAFKEWAVVCAALATGRQAIILRKGGIDEGREGFRVKHQEFWLLPTRFHQDASQLTADAEPLWRQVLQQQPPAGTFLIDLYAVVQEVFEVSDLKVLERLAGEHILSKQTVEQRFHYRQPGLFVLAVRIYRIPQPHSVADNPYIAGCKSWVELPEALSIDESKAVLDDASFAKRSACIERLAGEMG